MLGSGGEMSSQNYNGSKFSGQNSNKLFPAGAQADLLKTHYDPKLISKLSSFLQELKHISSKPTMIQNYSPPNKLFPAGAQAHLLKRSNNIEKKSDPTNPAKFNTEEFCKSKKRVTVMMQTKKLQHNQFSRSICIAP
jgi:hypothetical protein